MHPRAATSSLEVPPTTGNGWATLYLRIASLLPRNMITSLQFADPTMLVPLPQELLILRLTDPGWTALAPAAAAVWEVAASAAAIAAAALLPLLATEAVLWKAPGRKRAGSEGGTSVSSE